MLCSSKITNCTGEDMTLKILFIIALTTFAPIFELRLAIPLFYREGYNLALIAVYCTFINILIAPVVFLFLNTLHKLFYKIKWYKSLFDKIVGRARTKIHRQVEKYGYIGLMFFVCLPLPFTGAYAGTLGAWILGLDKKKSLLFISLGVIIAGTIVTLLTLTGSIIIAAIIVILIAITGSIIVKRSTNT